MELYYTSKRRLNVRMTPLLMAIRAACFCGERAGGAFEADGRVASELEGVPVVHPGLQKRGLGQRAARVGAVIAA